MKQILTIILLFISLHVWAQFPSELQDTFHSILTQYKSSSNAVGLSVAVKQGEHIWASVDGNSSETDSLTTESLFGMGSISKTITSATILQMMEEGLLTLEDSIGMYLDSMANIPEEVTIRQLLNHTSGIFNYTNNPDISNTLTNPNLITTEDVLENYVLAPIFAPGEQWSYSNTNYLLLGIIIEKISGQAYYTAARERFGFDSRYTSFSSPPYESEVADLAHIFTDLSGTGQKVDLQALNIFNLDNLFAAAAAAGSYVGTTTDVVRWTYDLYTGKHLSESTMDALFTIEAPSLGYGLGVIVFDLDCSVNLVGHDGSILYTAIASYNADEDMAIAVNTNDADVAIVAGLSADLFCAYEAYSMTTSVDSRIDEAAEMTVFPNPFLSDFTLSYPSQQADHVRIELVNNLGQLVQTIQPPLQNLGTYRMNVSHELAPGVYFVKVMINNQVYTKRVVKM